MSALRFLKEFEQLIKDSSGDGKYKNIEIEVNLGIHCRVICAIEELNNHTVELKAKDEAFKLIAEEVYMKAIREKDEKIDSLYSLVESLWQIVDDIDTYGDMAKSDDKLFRALVEKKQQQRWKLPITTDGYKIFIGV